MKRLHFCAGILQRLGISQKPICDPGCTLNFSKSYKNFVNFRSLPSEILWRVCRMWADAHMQNKHICIVSTGVHRLIFTKLSVKVEKLVGFLTVYSNTKGPCYGNRFVARVSENWHTPSSFSPLVFNNCFYEHHNMDYCINTANPLSVKIFVNFGFIISEILWRVWKE